MRVENKSELEVDFVGQHKNISRFTEMRRGTRCSRRSDSIFKLDIDELSRCGRVLNCQLSYSTHLKYAFPTASMLPLRFRKHATLLLKPASSARSVDVGKVWSVYTMGMPDSARLSVSRSVGLINGKSVMIDRRCHLELQNHPLARRLFGPWDPMQEGLRARNR
ncbi:MAG: hypothetical protein QOD67_2354 [Caballeronia sp.]|nr:hypothetical protein [Caballeronia sp.]